ncbi:MAG: DUF333 domain-containing protein [Nannocystaceae bacterium]
MTFRSLHTPLLCSLFVVIVGCRPNADTTNTPNSIAKGEPTTTTPPDGAQVPNPASKHCIDKGGKLEIVDEPAGQKGVCTLPDGTKCEEWAYMRGECPPAEGNADASEPES